MICLSSAAVVRLARAVADARKAVVMGGEPINLEQAVYMIHSEEGCRLLDELLVAADALADEVIATGHHEREGD